MVDKITTEKNYKTIPIGKDMVELIKLIEDKFEKEYGFKPDGVKITNLIARRVMESGLF